MKLILFGIVWLFSTVEMILTLPTEKGESQAIVEPLDQSIATPIGAPAVQTLIQPVDHTATQTLRQLPEQTTILTYQQPIALYAFPTFLRYPDQPFFQSSFESADQSDFEIFVQSPDRTFLQSVDPSEIPVFLQPTDQTSTFIQSVRRPTDQSRDQPADTQTLPQPTVQPPNDIDFVVWSG